jgi:PAS domain-containing protein
MPAKSCNHVLKILWVFLFIYLSLDFWLLFRNPCLPRAAQIPLIIASILAMIGWLYITIRMFLFKTRLRRLLKLIFEGNYDAGMKDDDMLADELCSMNNFINKVVARLKENDGLRAEKVELKSRALELVSRMTVDGIMVADIEARNFQLNPVVQEMFGLKLEQLDFDAIEKRPANAAFFKAFWNAVKHERVPKETDVSLQLPIRDTTHEITATILPIKDRTETVKIAIIFVRSKLP